MCLFGLTLALALHRQTHIQKHTHTQAVKAENAVISANTRGPHKPCVSLCLHLQSAFVAPLCCVIIDLGSDETRLLFNSRVDLNSMLNSVTSISSADELLNAALKSPVFLYKVFLYK